MADALNRTIAASVSDTCIYTMQDLLNLGNEARINTPATLGGNWTWRMLDGAITRELERKLTDWTETYFRIPSKLKSSFPNKSNRVRVRPQRIGRIRFSRARSAQFPRAASLYC